MSDTEAPSPSNNHTLAYLRRMDRRQNELLELFIRQQDLIGRLDRNMREGFESLQKQMQDGFARSDRNFGEVRNDLITLENSNLNRSSEHYESSVRLNRHDERIAALEAVVFLSKP